MSDEVEKNWGKIIRVWECIAVEGIAPCQPQSPSMNL